MKYFELTKQEKEILKNFEKGKLQRIKGFKEKSKAYIEYANNTLTKTKNINIRLSEKDILKLKSKAVRLGIPYQTLVTSILHRLAMEEKPFAF